MNKIASCIVEYVKENPESTWTREQLSPRSNKINDKPCDIFICCSIEDQFQYLDGFINPLVLKYNLKTINPQQDIDIDSIGLVEYFIAECKLYFVVITSSYYSNTLTSLFTRRALHYSNKVSKKVIVVLMDYEPAFVSHARYMRPLELEDAELIVYNEDNIEKSCDEFHKIVSKIQ